MSEKKEKMLPFRPFLSFPFGDEDFWGLDFSSQSGLSVSEDKNHVFVEAHLPGLQTDDIELSFERGMLWIKGEKKEEEEDKKKKYYRKASSSFSYRVQVPGQIDEKKVPEATYKDGVLKITFSKAPQSQAKKITIKTK
jgi:HSP20 family protein